ncbi:MAG: metal-sulfur cluster assembly factor [Anaerolineae bacterium]|nr:metal-sulfur cluster assembly factor [Anaerolineae bacterium]
MSDLTEAVVREALRAVMDPELGANVVDLGMVRGIEIADGQVTVKLVLTAPGCPLAGLIAWQAQRAVAALPGVKGVQVKFLDEPWQPPSAAQDWQSWLNGLWRRP